MTETITPPSEPASPPPPTVRTDRRRARIAEILAVVAVLTALVAAIGPAERTSAVFSWPPTELPPRNAHTMWFTPLLLSARIPESIDVEIPCALRPALGETTPSTIVLATARSPVRNGGLHVSREGRELVVSSGRRELARAPLDGDAVACSYRLVVRDGRWSLEGGPAGTARSGELGAMPTVSGLFSELDLRSGGGPTVEVQSRPFSTRATTIQTIARVATVVLLVLVLSLLCFSRRPRLLASAGSALRRARRSADATDAVVAGGLLAWWAIAPVHYDDGWAIARQRTFDDTGGFSEYFHIFGSNIPNGYWLEWLTHWLTVSTDAVLVLRLPPLLFLACVWVLCRWTVAQVVQGDRAARWAIAPTFLLGAMAWGMTLRPEAMTALLVTATLACAVAFHQRATVQPLAIAAVLVPLALTAHHAGLLTLAPLLVIAPQVIAWVRANPVPAMATGAASFALSLLLLFVGSDIGQRAQEAQVMQAYGQQGSWFDEVQRYAVLSDDGSFGMGALVRRTFVAVMLLTVVAFIARRKKTLPADIAPGALVLALLLLAFIPSKWAWHFGALVGVAAAATSVEVARMRDAQRNACGWDVRPLIGVVVATLAIAWSWSPAINAGWLDLASLDWATRRRLWTACATALPLAIMAALVGVARLRGRSLVEVPWRTQRLMPVLIAVPAVAFTVGVFVVDALQSPWTPTRQNLGALVGRAGCGLADQLQVPDRASFEPIQSSPARSATWVPPAPGTGLTLFSLGPTSSPSDYSPWTPVPDREHVGFWVTESGALGNVVRVEWGETFEGVTTSVASGLIREDRGAPVHGAKPWRFIGSNQLPERPAGANAWRIGLDETSPVGTAAAVTGPVAYDTTPFGAVIRLSGSGTLLSAPPLLTYFPCAELPRLEALVQAPDLVVSMTPSPDPSLAVGFRTSPFRGVSDIYRLDHLTYADPLRRPANFRIYRVDKRIPGAVLAPAERRDVIS